MLAFRLLNSGSVIDGSSDGEQIDPDTGEQTGNFPQAFSHVGLINAAWRLASVSEG
jgi:GH15 family glucan-1,4-alpha-glucosidase